ncbi:LysR substrate-binding domain-containing protein [Rodentibacter genomosp. 2]|uniref:LysR substrate-binding domain-containing protein n=1 Tax=Rodentibacter genomosp. 2 TaxID=1908266 RepID=UPI0026AEB29B
MGDISVPETLRFKPLFEEDYVCVMRQTHPLAEQPIDLELFCQQQFVLGSFARGGFYGATDRVLSTRGKQRKVGISMQNFALIPEILRKIDCLAVTPRHLIQP